jgi:hypothetical protein
MFGRIERLVWVALWCLDENHGRDRYDAQHVSQFMTRIKRCDTGGG